MSIADRFEEQIETGQLGAPLPRWPAVLKRWAWWSAMAVFCVLGIASAGVAVWFMLDPTDVVMGAENSWFLEKILQILPIFWATVSTVCGFVAIWIFYRSPHGYRHRILAVGAVCLTAFLCLGAAMASAGMADKVEEIAALLLPPYKAMARPQPARFMRPEQGFIIGNVHSVGTSTIELEDPEGETWLINVSLRANVPPTRKIIPGSCLRVAGRISTTTKITQAETIKPCPRSLHFAPPGARMKE